MKQLLVKPSPYIKKILELINELLQDALDELKSELSKVNLLTPTLDQILSLNSKQLLNYFITTISPKLALSMGLKAKALIKNVLELRKLQWMVCNFDSVTFYNYLTSLLYNEMSDNNFRRELYNKIDRVLKIGNDIAEIGSYSIFKSCSQHVIDKVEHLKYLSKQRVYTFVKEENHIPGKQFYAFGDG